MKKYIKTLFVLSATLILASCNSGVDNSSNLNNSSDSSVDVHDSSSTTPNVPVDEEYIIKVQETAGVNITADKSKAKKGETITLTVSVSSGVTLTAIKVNDDMTTKVNDTTYTFVMPNRDAIIRAYVSIEGDVVLTGDIAAALVLEDGIYVARNVAVNERSHIAYAIKGENGQVEQLSIVKIDRTKTNADIDLATNYDAGFMLAGNAKYDFFYDPTNEEEPCYIQRVELLSAPNSVVQFESLLAGKVKSSPSTYPTGVSKVHYTSTLTNDDYTWEAYENSSYALVKKLGTNEEKAFVYKEISGDVYTVVDTYIEGVNDDSRSEDQSKFSGLYSIVDAYNESSYKKYQYTLKDAQFDAMSYSHDVYSIDRDLHWGYRTGFDTEWDESLKAANVNYSVKTNDDGSYTSTISSYKTKETTDESSSSNQTIKEHRTYEIEVTFNKAGNMLNGSYVEKVYDENAYDFSSMNFLPNGELQFELVEEMHFEYTYGDVKSGKPTLANKDSYFVSEITDAKVNNAKMNAENTLDLGDFVSDYLELSFAPTTALDTWQYGVTASSDNSVIGPRSASEPLTYMVHKPGEATLTVNNHTTNNVSKTFKVTVPETFTVRSFFMQNTDGDWDNILADRATIYANTIREVYCYASKYEGNDIEFTPVSDNEMLAVSKKGQRLVLDATGAANITEEITVKVTINCPYYEDPSNPKVFSITILPNSNNAKEGIVGTWQGVDAENDQNVTVTFNDDGTGTLIASQKGSYNFTYTYNENTGKLSMQSGSGEFVYYIVKYDSSTETLELLVYRYGYGDSYEYDIVGYYLTDEEGYEIESVYVTFSKQ